MMKAEDTSSSALSGGSDAGEMAVSRSEGEAGAAAGEVVLASMLAKRAQGRSHFGRLNWKQRWFELTSDELSYWNAEGGRNNPQAECKGAIELRAVHAVEFVAFDAFNKTYMFQVVHNSVLYVQCTTKEECERWVKSIRRFILFNEYLHPQYHPGYFDDKDKQWSCCKQPSKDIKGCKPAHDYASRRRKEAVRGSDARSSIGSFASFAPAAPKSKRASAASYTSAGEGLPRKNSKSDMRKAVLKASENVQPIVVRPARTSYV